MDAPMNDDRMDQALRKLFAEQGALQAPPGMESRIMQRIAVLPQHRASIERPLMPALGWGVVVLIIAGLVVIGATLPSEGSGASLIPSFDLSGILSSKWVLAAVGCAAVLLGLEQWLGRQRVSRSA